MQITEIKQIEKEIYTSIYLEDRELLWNKKVIEYKKMGVPLWNGAVYYVEKIQDNIAHIGLCEYKDLIFVEGKNTKDVKEKYDLDFNFTYINVQILIKNKKDKYLFGTKCRDEYVEIIPVGGTLRLENGFKIKSLSDIKEYAKKEMLIETKIKVDLAKLHFVDVIINKNICTFLFSCIIESTSDRLLNTGEFDGEVYLDRVEIFNDEKTRTSIRLESIRNFFEEKWKNRKL